MLVADGACIESHTEACGGVSLRPLDVYVETRRVGVAERFS